MKSSKQSTTQSICLKCALCCNGVIFSDVKLMHGDEPVALSSAGLEFFKSGSRPRFLRFAQPCSALKGCQCRIYDLRPKYCRQFECLTFKALAQGSITRAEALRLIRAARRRAAKVGRLLQELGNEETEVALAERFRRTSKRLERGEVKTQEAERYGRLTVAFHDLNRLISEAFYPMQG